MSFVVYVYVVVVLVAVVFIVLCYLRYMFMFVFVFVAAAVVVFNVVFCLLVEHISSNSEVHKMPSSVQLRLLYLSLKAPFGASDDKSGVEVR